MNEMGDKYGFQPINKPAVDAEDENRQSRDSFDIKIDPREDLALKLENKLAKFTAYETKSPRVAPSTSAGTQGHAGFQHPHRKLTESLPKSEVQELLFEHQSTLCAILQSVLDAKKELDSALGVKIKQNDEDDSDIEIAARLGDPNKNKVKETSPLAQNVIQIVETMSQLMGLAKTFGYDGEGMSIIPKMHELQTENIKLREEVEVGREQVKLLETALEMERVKMSKSKSKPHGHVEEFRQKFIKVQHELSESQKRSTSLILENGQLRDTLSKARSDLNKARYKHSKETAWFQPKLATLEEMVITTATAFDHMSMDVELLTGMYTKLCDQVVGQEDNVKLLRDERDLLSDKLRKLIKLMQDVRTENRRKEKIINALMATRHEMTKTVKDSKLKMIRLENEASVSEKSCKEKDNIIAEIEDDRVQLRGALQASEVQVLEMQNEIFKLREANSAGQGEELARIEELEKENQELKQSTRSEEEYQELDLRLQHAIKAYQNLEQQLNKRP
mmetsp:Transcript_3259/g.6066  ORF Transcript_3259/g.6066 Transcript_3259/m.6066 type:complete len:506 (-) Transcript_3259:2206-3723(-)